MQLLPQNREQKRGCIIGASISFILYSLGYFFSFAAGQNWLTNEGIQYIHWVVCCIGSIVGIIFSLYPRFKGSLVIYMIAQIAVISLNIIYFLAIIDQYVSYMGQLLGESAIQVSRADLEVGLMYMAVKVHQAEERDQEEEILPQLKANIEN